MTTKPMRPSASVNADARMKTVNARPWTSGWRAMDAIARQPEAAGTIRSNMIIAMGLLESLTIYGLLIAFLLIGQLG